MASRGRILVRNAFLGALLSLALFVAAPAMAQRATPPAPMTISVAAFPDGTRIPDKYTQSGDSVSPEIKWENLPKGTRSLVLHMHDLDVVRNKTTDDQLHWLVWNIPPTASGLPEGVPSGSPRPDGSQQVSASGPVYRGPGAPANGPLHHYTFELYALDTKLALQPGEDAFATRRQVLAAMQGHILGKAVYGGLFRRPE
jgi:Raf kinase inhibitor-like YbhB/YbcL family protein